MPVTPTPPTTNFGFTRVAKGESDRKNGYAALDADRLTLDALLTALRDHQHTGTPKLEDPDTAPTLVASTTGGALPAGTTFYYKISYLDAWGLETAASPEAYIATTDPIDTPSGPTLTVENGAYQLQTGVYRYVISYITDNGGETSSSPVSNITVSGSGPRIRIDLPALPGADGYRIYRAAPNQASLYYLDETTSTPYYDDGTVSPDTSTIAPRQNTTNATNAINVDVGTLPVAASGWKIYRTTVSGQYGVNTLVHRVVETVEETSSVLVTDWDDQGLTLHVGSPRLQSATISDGRLIDESATSLDILARGAQSWDVFASGTIADSTTVAQMVAATDPVKPVSLTAYFQTAPSGLDSNDYITIRITDSAATPTYVELDCQDDTQWYTRKWTLTESETAEAEDGDRSAASYVTTDETAFNQAAVRLPTAATDYVEYDFGTLEPGDYTPSVRIRLAIGTTNTCTLEAIRTSDSAVLSTDTFTVDWDDYQDEAGADFTLSVATGVKIKLSYTTGIGDPLVDQLSYDAVLPELDGTTDIACETYVNGTPSANGGNVQVRLTY